MIDCEPGPDLQLVGVAPFEIRCVAAPDDPELPEVAVAWRFGDGETATGFVVTHVYEAGSWPLSVDVGPEETTRGNVVACAVPAPAFTWEFLGGLRYRVVQEAIAPSACLDQLRWEVFRGKDRDGARVFTSTHWEPEFEVPEEGTYTVVLTQGGLAGTGAAAATIEANGGLGDLQRENSIAATCFGAGAAGAWLLPLAVAAPVVRRRRDRG